jgi:hypothetical protein
VLALKLHVRAEHVYVNAATDDGGGGGVLVIVNGALLMSLVLDATSLTRTNALVLVVEGSVQE